MYYHHNEPAPVISPYGIPADPKTPTPPPGRHHRRLGIGLLSWLSPVLGICAMVVVLPYLTGSGPDVEVQSGSGFAEIDGREVALVPYDRNGSSDLWSDMFQLRLAAVDLASGEEVWDTQLADALAMDAKVLVAGEEYVYVTSGDGLFVVDLADGDVVAAEDEIDGLGEAYLAAYSAYGYDEAAESVIVLDRDGGIRTIPLDFLTASRADDGLARTWSQRLNPDGHGPTTFTNEKEGLLAPDKVVRLSPVGSGEGVGLNIVTHDGDVTRLGEQVFYDAAIVIDESDVYGGRSAEITPTRDWAELTSNSVDTDTGVVAGHTADLVVVRHKKSDASDAVELSVVSLRTGEVLITETSAGEPGGAVSRADGTTLLPISGTTEVFSPDHLAVIDPTGDVDVHEIGDTSPFGGL